jgi:hypothetical protein
MANVQMFRLHKASRPARGAKKGTGGNLTQLEDRARLPRAITLSQSSPDEAYIHERGTLRA